LWVLGEITVANCPKWHYDGFNDVDPHHRLSTGLMVYWISRMRILWHGSDDHIDTILAGDLALGRRIITGLWPAFIGPIQMAG